MALHQPIEDLYPVHPQFLNHDIMHCALDAEEGSYLYSGRALGITTTYDIIQLHRDLMEDFPVVCAHYDRIGLSYTRQIIWNLKFEELRHYPQYDVSYFYFGSEQHEVAHNENWFRAVDYINSRNHFMALAQQLDMRVPLTYCFQNRAQLDQAALAKIPYPCYLKAAISVAGLGIYRCENEQALLLHLSSFGEATPFQVQQEVRASTFLNLQYQVTGSHLERLAATEQILDGYSHAGNRFPSPHNAWYAVEPMAKWLFCHGVRGIFAFDVAVVKDACGIDYLPIECHPRFNGASYPTLIAKKLGIPRWQARLFYTDFRHIADLPIWDLEYNPSDQSGIVVVNWGTVQAGKLFILLAGTPVQQQALREELQQRL
ncbi:MAG: ATP-grasp domain-containing protein [Gammaproteobacteria bacterium]